MHRFINQINVSITTNRTCTLRCDHCYIAPHLFDDKSQMTTETFRSIFPQIESLYLLDHNLEEVEWEAIGGETTMMPFEWWEENLPWALDWIHAFNQRHGLKGSLNFLTNLIYSDSRYTGLINKYGSHPAFCLYTSWEPDTNRFGKKNKLYKKFKQTLASVHAKKKILDLILTKDLVALGPKWVIDEFVPLGVNDFSIKMLSPYGSGKAFFVPNMVSFEEMRDFLVEMGRIKPDHVTYTPQDEMQSSLFRGTSFQCNGNFKYDIAIEPDGITTFNASQTADEAALGLNAVHIEDANWPIKVLIENKTEESAKLTLSHPECHQCEFMHYCNAGWYHYKIHDPKIIASYSEKECPGYKEMWEDEKKKLGEASLFERRLFIHQEHVRAALTHREAKSAQGCAPLSSLRGGYEAMADSLAHERISSLEADVPRLYGKTLLDWTWILDDLRITFVLPLAPILASDHPEEIITHFVYGNYHSVRISPESIWDYVQGHPKSRISLMILEAASVIDSCLGRPAVESHNEIGMIHDDRNNELYRWVYRNPAPEVITRSSRTLDPSAKDYLRGLITDISREEALSSGIPSRK